jgi:isoleucyl-tRNA synthetase
VLHMLCRAASPLMPLITEQIFLNLTGNQSSVHLAEFPHIDYKVDHDLIRQMERVRAACTASLFIRNETGIRVRQPLQSVTFIGVAEQGFSDELTQLILDEINVKEWFNLDKSKILEFANYKLQIKFPVLGKRVPHKVKDIIAAQKQGAWEFKDNQLKITDETLLPEEFELLLEPKAEYVKAISSLATNDALVLLDLNVSDELRLEGVARDLVRAIQQARKDAGLDISDRINVALNANDNDVVAAVNDWKDYIKEQTLALDINNQAISPDMQKSSADLNGITVEIGIAKAK